MRFHVVGIPFTNTTNDFPDCAFTTKVIKFSKMMTNAGHTVFLYSGEHNTAVCHEHIPCFTETERIVAAGTHHTSASYDGTLPQWRKFNSTVAAEIRKRAKPHDFVCVISGTANAQLADDLPDMMVVEFGIGYPGTFARFRVFESYAWMHTVYGSTSTNPATLDGNFFDAVIPSYFESDQFPLGTGDGDYLLFVGRLIDRKGVHIAELVAKELGKRLIIAGYGTPPAYGEHVGVVGAARRAELMGGATALLAPTIYIEPFGSVVPEAHMCGTPTLTTDWGAFTETVVDGVNGFRCRTLGEFVAAAQQAATLDRQRIFDTAHATYSLEAVAVRYEKYFGRLLTLWDDGWYSMKNFSMAMQDESGARL